MSIRSDEPAGISSQYTWDAPLNYDVVQRWMRENGAYRPNGNCLSSAVADTDSLYDSISCPPGTFRRVRCDPEATRRLFGRSAAGRPEGSKSSVVRWSHRCLSRQLRLPAPQARSTHPFSHTPAKPTQTREQVASGCRDTGFVCPPPPVVCVCSPCAPVPKDDLEVFILQARHFLLHTLTAPSAPATQIPVLPTFGANSLATLGNAGRPRNSPC